MHSGWHYSTHWAPHAHLEYVLWGQQYYRTWDVPDGNRGGTGEGTWDAANYGYGGGVQMDGTFQSNYGSEYIARYGAAGHWPVQVQILVAYRGWLVQGWGAWPNTSHGCGLR